MLPSDSVDLELSQSWEGKQGNLVPAVSISTAMKLGISGTKEWGWSQPPKALLSGLKTHVVCKKYRYAVKIDKNKN